MTVETFSIGTEVEVYCSYCPWVQYRKFMVASEASICLNPKIFRSDGWVKAIVADVSDKDPRMVVLGGAAIAASILQCPVRNHPESPGGPWVKVKYLDKTWVDKEGNILNERSLFQWIDVGNSKNIRRVGSVRSSPKISALVVRWGGSTPIDEKRFDFAVGDKLVQEMMDQMHSTYKQEIEIFTVFITHTSDLRSVSERWAAMALQNGTHKVAFYLLWGSNNDRKPGYVLSIDLIDFMERMESVGIVTRYPNHSGLYKLITSKDYQPMLCMNTEFRIPATVSVPISKIFAIESVYKQTLDNLISLREKLHHLTPDSFVGGLVKVGSEWMGDGVRVFANTNEDIRSKALSMLDGTHGNPTCLLFQDRVPKIVCEPRVFVYNGEIKEIRYTWNEKLDKVTGRVHAMRTCHASRAATEKFDGDTAGQEFVEAEIRKIVSNWMNWLVCVSGEIPVFVRIDFLVEDLRQGNGSAVLSSPSLKFRVWTCELGEIGSSMVGFKEGREMLFKAIADSCTPSVRSEKEVRELEIPKKPTRPPPSLDL